MLRVEVRYLKPGNYVEVGLVDYPPDGELVTPTLFVGAYCPTKEDREWFERKIKDLTAAPQAAQQAK